MVITCDNVCELLLMERRVTGKPSCTVRGGGKAGNIRNCRLTYHHRRSKGANAVFATGGNGVERTLRRRDGGRALEAHPH